MTKAPAKTLREREQELATKLRTPTGRRDLEDLARMYALVGAGERAAETSVVAYILVHECVSGRLRP